MTQQNDTSATRILVVDDDATFRGRLAKALEARGYEAYPAADAPQAMEVAQRVQPGRVVVDLRMPGRGGVELVGDLHRFDASMEVVVLTAYGSIATAVEALHRGAIDYLTKPADTDQVLAAFEQVPHVEADDEGGNPSLARVEWEHIQRVLLDCGGNITQAARRLGIHRRSLQRKLAKFPPPQ